jgi:chromosome segregation ATPase
MDASTGLSSIRSLSKTNSRDSDNEGDGDCSDCEEMRDFVDDFSRERKKMSGGKGNTGTPSSSSKTLLGSSTVSTSTELGEIQRSVRRLRAQRTNVERLGERNEELERQLSEKKAENETLQREIFTLRGAEHENVAYLQSVKLLEQRARRLEEACCTKRLELRSTSEKLSSTEQERDQLRQELQDVRQDYEEEVGVLKAKNDKLLQRVERLEHSHGAQTDDRKCLERHWKQKMKAATRASSQTIDTVQQQLERSCKEAGKLETEVRELEEQVQNLLATTVRQTTVIEECERAMSEAKAQQQQTQRSYEEQLQLACELSAKTQRVEAQLASLKLSKGSEVIDLEKKMTQLECKLSKRNDQLQATEDALRDKEKELEVMQRAYVTRDHNRSQSDEVRTKCLHHVQCVITSKLAR